MYSIINETGTFLAKVPPSGQMLVRLPTSTMLDIGGVHIRGRSDVLELKPVFVADQLSEVKHSDVERLREETKKLKVTVDSSIFDDAHDEIGYKVDWDSFKHYPLQYTLICLTGICSCSVLVCFVLCAKGRVNAWHFNKKFRTCQRECDCDCD